MNYLPKFIISFTIILTTILTTGCKKVEEVIPGNKSFSKFTNQNKSVENNSNNNVENIFSSFNMKWDPRVGDCVAPGNNCTVPNVVNKKTINKFISLIEEGNESEFFTNNYDWQTMFPGLVGEEEYLNMITSREVLCKLLKKPNKLLFLFILSEANMSEDEEVKFVCQVTSEANSSL